MYFLLSIGINFFSAAVILLPVFLLLHFVHFRKMLHTALFFLLSLYFASVYFITGLPTVQFFEFEPTFYLLPFIGIADDIRNSLLNIILFLPLGFVLPLVEEKKRNYRSVLLFGFSCSLFIELAQLFTFRLTDVNDLITNTLGAALGYFLSRPLWKRTSKPVSLRRSDLCLTAIITVAVMFFLQPFLSNMIWMLIP